MRFHSFAATGKNLDEVMQMIPYWRETEWEKRNLMEGI
jgi:hypothetical protein